MFRRCRGIALIALLPALGLAPTARSTIVAPGYTVNEIPLPDFATGDIVVAGGALFAGVGSFGGATESVVRIDGSGTHVIANGFNSLGGFAYDAANDRLIVADNGEEAPGSETGDTIYAIPDPLGSFATPLRGRNLELLPSGSIPAASDLVLDPTDPTDNHLFLTDASASFPPAGRLLSIDLSARSLSVLQSGLGFAAGLAASATTLFLGDVDGTTFAGSVSGIPLPGTAKPSPIATGLAGQYDLELEPDGRLLGTSGGNLLRIDPSTGAVSTVASGFGFATGLFDDGGTIYVLDGGFPGLADVFQLVPIPEPASAVALASGLAALAARRRTGSIARRRRVAQGLGLAVLALLAAVPAQAGRPRVPLPIVAVAPLPGQQVTYAPLHLAVTLDAAGNTNTFQALLNGHDVTSEFSFAAPANGRIAATADYVWDGTVLPGTNQLVVKYSASGTPLQLTVAFQAVGDPYADAVVAYSIGSFGGFPGTNFLPGIVTGPPKGKGLFQGGLDVFSLGFGGSITLAFVDNVIVDQPGPDFAVFENAFLVFNPSTLLIERPFADPGIVSVSQDGVDWHEFPCSLVVDAPHKIFYPGCAGVYPVLSNADDPSTPHASIPTQGTLADLIGASVSPPPAPGGGGGDRFDLAQVGLAWARYVRIVDANVSTGDPFGSTNAGFDLDAIAAIHSAPATDANGDGIPDAVQ